MKHKSGQLLLISDLEKMTGVGRSTIHHYLRKGLLAPPQRTARTMAYYGPEQVEQLKTIRRLRKEGYSLSLIKKMVVKDKRVEPEAGGAGARPDRKQQIMKEAVTVFAGKGYHKTRVSDITQAVGVGYSTFYLYFPSKKELLLEYVDDILHAMFSDVIEELKNENDPLKRIRKGAEVAITSHPEFLDILSVLRSTVEDDPRLKAKRWEIYEYIVEHVQRDLQKAIKFKLIPPTDVEMVAYTLVIGVLETATLLQGGDGDFDAGRLLDALQDMFLRG
ncbi:MAG: MerR family transcriptional regulator [Actinomycetota bacterium]|nr:MerR family transcriptional regulator [Actinomycetota bacterium]